MVQVEAQIVPPIQLHTCLGLQGVLPISLISGQPSDAERVAANHYYK